MEYVIVSSILTRKIQIGNARIPAVLIPVAICLFGIIMGLNAIYLKRYYKLISYFEKFYPEIYERIRIKPDIGTLYSTGNKVKPLIDFAKHHEPLDDPKAEKMLVDFIEFDQQTTWLGSAIIIIAILCLLIIGVVFKF